MIGAEEAARLAAQDRARSYTENVDNSEIVGTCQKCGGPWSAVRTEDRVECFLCGERYRAAKIRQG